MAESQGPGNQKPRVKDREAKSRESRTEKPKAENQGPRSGKPRAKSQEPSPGPSRAGPHNPGITSQPCSLQHMMTPACPAPSPRVQLLSPLWTADGLYTGAPGRRGHRTEGRGRGHQLTIR